MHLLSSWISVNMGAAFANTRPSLGSLLHHTRSNKPIIVILDDPLIDSFSKIKEIYKQNHKAEDAAISLNSLVWTESLK